MPLLSKKALRFTANWVHDVFGFLTWTSLFGQRQAQLVLFQILLKPKANSMRPLTFCAGLVLFISSVSSFSLRAQHNDRIFRPFRIDVGMSYVKPQKLDSRYAFGFSMEPKYGITDAFWVGLRLEAGILVQSAPQYHDDYQALGIFSALPTLDYSLVINEKFRPFIGIGGGPYRYQLFFDGEDAKPVPVVTRMGFCPRIGFDHQNFRMALEYNSVPQGRSYTSVKIGWCIGGGTVD